MAGTTHRLSVVHIGISWCLLGSHHWESEFAQKVLSEFIGISDLEGAAIQIDLLADVEILDRVIKVIVWWWF